MKSIKNDRASTYIVEIAYNFSKTGRHEDVLIVIIFGEVSQLVTILDKRLKLTVKS
jgi:hypothetical protein